MQLSEWHVYIEVIPPHRSAERLKVRASVDEAVRNRWKTKGRLGTTSVFPVHERELLGDNPVHS